MRHPAAPTKLPPASLPVGAAEASMFFDQYPAFGNRRPFMNLRHQAIIGQNVEILHGARVLDLACSDGAWSFAALKAGAAHVVGIESRGDKIERAHSQFTEYGMDPATYDFVVGDVFDVPATQRPQADVVLCLGFLYHTLRYPELFSLIAATGAHTIIIDTEVATLDAPVIRVLNENVDAHGNASADRYSSGGTVLSGRPSLTAIGKMLRVYGFDVSFRSDWAAILRDNDWDFPVYRRGARVTLRCVRSEPICWQEEQPSRR